MSNFSQLAVGWPPNGIGHPSGTSVAEITRVSTITFATGILGHLATSSSYTSFAFPGLETGSLLLVSPQSSLSTAFFVAWSAVSATNVGGFQLSNQASIATLSPKVWRAIGVTFA